jgi:nucleotide-binding universal stress UspA family protein
LVHLDEEAEPMNTDADQAVGDERPRGLAHVLVASDGSQAGALAVQRAISVLDHPRRITLLRVLTHVPDEVLDEEGDPLYTPEQLTWHWNVEVREAELELAGTALPLGDARVDERIEAGSVARAVCDVARELRVDVIVVGCRARSKLARLFLRSVSEQVLHNTPCPVLVVPEHRDG